MRHATALLVCLPAVILLSPSATASLPVSWPAAPRFGVLLTVADDPSPRLGEKFRIRVAAGGGTKTAVGEVHIAIPDGFQVVAGDTSRQVHPSNNWMGPQDREWDLYLRPTRTGVSTLRGWIRIARAPSQGWDESESVLDFDVRADTVIVRRFSRAIRHERVVDRQRFRYGWQHVVLIDGPEEDVEGNRAAESSPQAIATQTGTCRGCGLTEPRAVRLVVTVGVDGTVRWIEPRPASAAPEDSRVIDAAEQAVKRWLFRPARLGDRAIPNWAEVEVTVLPESE